MKKKVELSTWSIVMTIVSFVILIGLVIWEYYRTQSETIVWILFGIVCIWGFSCLYYAPMSVNLTSDSLNIDRALGPKKLKLDEIRSVKLCQPTMGEKRLCGSGGCFGYWGWFRDGEIGKYFAYYGKASDCFVVLMRDGRKYMLGCKDAPEMVLAITTAITSKDTQSSLDSVKYK